MRKCTNLMWFDLELLEVRKNKAMGEPRVGTFFFSAGASGSVTGSTSPHRLENSATGMASPRSQQKPAPRPGVARLDRAHVRGGSRSAPLPMSPMAEGYQAILAPRVRSYTAVS